MFRPKHLLFTTPFTALLIALCAGCTTDTDDTIDRDAERIGDTSISFPAPAASRDDSPLSARTSRPDDPPAVEVKNEIPSEAVQLQGWEDNRLAHEAAEPGFIYIFDETDNRIVYSGHLHRGERFILDRDRGRATINGVIVYSQDRDEARNFKVYFDRG